MKMSRVGKVEQVVRMKGSTWLEYRATGSWGGTGVGRIEPCSVETREVGNQVKSAWWRIGRLGSMLTHREV